RPGLRGEPVLGTVPVARGHRRRGPRLRPALEGTAIAHGLPDGRPGGRCRAGRHPVHRRAGSLRTRGPPFLKQRCWTVGQAWLAVAIRVGHCPCSIVFPNIPWRSNDESLPEPVRG